MEKKYNLSFENAMTPDSLKDMLLEMMDTDVNTDIAFLSETSLENWLKEVKNQEFVTKVQVKKPIEKNRRGSIKIEFKHPKYGSEYTIGKLRYSRVYS